MAKSRYYSNPAMFVHGFLHQVNFPFVLLSPGSCGHVVTITLITQQPSPVNMEKSTRYIDWYLATTLLGIHAMYSLDKLQLPT